VFSDPSLPEFRCVAVIAVVVVALVEHALAETRLIFCVRRCRWPTRGST
jgi:hypothetical protein